MHIFQNSNPFLNCLDTKHIKLRSFVHSTKITCSIWHNLTSKYYYFKRQFTHYIPNECLFISLQWSNYQLIQLLKMISNCCIILNAYLYGNRQTIFHVYSKSWKFQDNEIHCHQLAWSMNQLDYNIHGCSLIFYHNASSDTVSMVPNTVPPFQTIYSIDSTALYRCRPL